MALKKKTDRRSELLKAARVVFAARGYEATTVAEIVSHAGVAQGTFYLYFPSKMALVMALEEEMQQQIEAAIRAAYQQSTHPQALIEESVRAAFLILGEYRDILGVLHSSIRWAEAPEERKRIFAPYYALIADLIRQEQARNAVNPTLKPEPTAVLIVGLVYSAADECYLYQHEDNPATYISETIGFIRRALGTS